MAQFYGLRDKLQEVTRDYFAMTQEASDRRGAETVAAVHIQSCFRGSVVRARWHMLLVSGRIIQRVLRGFLARCKVSALHTARSLRMNRLFFDHCAAVIQKFFRGHWSRKTIHDYYRRKQYLAKIGERGRWTTAYLNQEFDEKVQAQKENEERAMRDEFDNLAGELHHLMSTASIPGVYNPPYSDVLPRAFNKPIEQHLRESCRVKLPKSLARPKFRPGPLPKLGFDGEQDLTRRPEGMIEPDAPPQSLPNRKPHNSRTASVGRMQKIQGPFRSKEQIEVANAAAANQNRSVQSSTPYDSVTEERKMQARLAKLTRVAAKDFLASSAAQKAAPVPSSVHANTPFRDRPMEFRGDFVELPQIRDKPPFFTSVKGGKQFVEYAEQGFVPSGVI